MTMYKLKKAILTNFAVNNHEAKPIVPQILFYFTFLSLLPLKLAIRKLNLL